MQPGTLVVCTDDSPNPMADDVNIFPNGYIKREEIYTVLCEAPEWIQKIDGNRGIMLEEKPVYNTLHKKEVVWKKSRFREIQPPVQDVIQWVNDNTLEYAELEKH